MRRLLTTTLAATAATLLVAGPAAAHVTANPSEGAAGGFARFAFRVGHGCDGAATESVSIQIPDGVVSVKPEVVPGWDATTETGEYDEPVDLHGEQVTEGVVSVTWTAQEGQELPDDHFREFGLSVRLPAEGGALYFPTVQECVDGSELAWIEIPSEDGEEPEHPAPSVTLTAASGDHGSSADEAEADPAATEGADEGTEGGVLAAAESSGTDPLTVVALVVGLAGLITGGAGLAAARRAR